MEAVRDMSGHWSPKRIHFESFLEGGGKRPEDKPFLVELAKSNQTLEVPVGKSILSRDVRVLSDADARRNGRPSRHGVASGRASVPDHGLRFPSHVRKAGPRPVAEPPIMKNGKLRIGVVGLWRAFSLMLPTFLADPRVDLVAGCDPRAGARDQFSRDFSRPAYEAVEALAADPEVEVIYVASPHQFHARHTQIAADHGKHVLVEKPMAPASICSSATATALTRPI
ncbi:hypothetical protein G6F65_018984 [Rhizopus arrhizus]|nr:hypothetical protein G6F65_018984 [Rhizopus arrhizus]